MSLVIVERQFWKPALEEEDEFEWSLSDTANKASIS